MIIQDGKTQQGLIPIVDTHQHLWDLELLRPPWLASVDDLLNRSYTAEIYDHEAQGTGIVQAVYMEVDVAIPDRPQERELISKLCIKKDTRTTAAVFSGSVDNYSFLDDLVEIGRHKSCRGIRQLLHPPTVARGTLLSEQFSSGLTRLADAGLLFDICIRPRELADVIHVAKNHPNNTFVLDHCGNADPKVVSGQTGASEDVVYAHERQQWLDDMAGIGQESNVVCKISGIVARAKSGWAARDLSPTVNHCIDCFGEDRVVFGSDWPVCVPTTPLSGWVSALREIVSDRSERLQHKLLYQNAQRIYRLD